jgi:hypothetical protein
MVAQDIKPLVKGIAQIHSVQAGGLVVYKIVATDESEYLLEIDLSNKADVGATATFNATEKALLLMRWIRKANENDTLIKIKG